MDESVRIYQETVRRIDEDRMRYERAQRHHEITQAAIQAAINLYVAQVSAPWQALAWYIRATDSAPETQR